ncbi:hypothetical protein [Rubricoccus marinus]|uniref:Uncharacterized protein n=1 Tax=Rubricoccus marinus TaxID=716817 RepID=A0A259TU59_9BACT|nr:hypothetical protein [Rubricoccus marinus]OZC01305.1 hypothetical protein BSZ36_17820 [Rubricoccus marinus]
MALDLRGYALAIFGLIVCLVAWNNERRIGAYMEGYRKRAIEIERGSGVSLITKGKERADTAGTFSNRKVFQLYYFVMLVGWIAVLVANLGSGPSEAMGDRPEQDAVAAPTSALDPEKAVLWAHAVERPSAVPSSGRST